MIREFSAQESLQFLEAGMEQLFHSEVRFGFSTSFIFIQGKKVWFSFQAKLSLRSGMREVIDVLGSYKLYKAYAWGIKSS